MANVLILVELLLAGGYLPLEGGPFGGPALQGFAFIVSQPAFRGHGFCGLQRLGPHGSVSSAVNFGQGPRVLGERVREPRLRSTVQVLRAASFLMVFALTRALV